jgi:uncharacterized lipoprotein
MRTFAVMASVVVLLLAGCDTKPREQPPDIIKPQRQALDKAKVVEQTIQKSDDQRREEPEKGGGGGYGY